MASVAGLPALRHPFAPVPVLEAILAQRHPARRAKGLRLPHNPRALRIFVPSTTHAMPPNVALPDRLNPAAVLGDI